MRIFLPLALCAACTGPIDQKPRLGPGDIADATAAAVGLSSGFVELNPLTSWAGDATPIVGLAVKYGLKWGLTKAGIPARDANLGVETASMAGACWSMSIMTGGTNPASAIAAVICGAIYLTQIERIECELSWTLPRRDKICVRRLRADPVDH